MKTANKVQEMETETIEMPFASSWEEDRAFDKIRARIHREAKETAELAKSLGWKTPEPRKSAEG
jgi:hypothetical protein